MIEAAERLFAERGYRAVSMRQVGAAAGQRNNSAAQYHFGSRQGLVDAIFEQRMVPINEQRTAMLEQLELEGRDKDLHGLLEALVVPLLSFAEDSDGPTYWARFLSQVAFLPEFDVFRSLDQPFSEGARIVIERVLEAMSHLPPAVAAARIQLVNRLMVLAAADRERLWELAPGVSTWRVVSGSDLVDLMAAIVNAPVSEATLAEVPSMERSWNGQAREAWSSRTAAQSSAPSEVRRSLS